MNQRKHWLSDLAQGQTKGGPTLALADAPAFPGVHRMETRNTIYILRDGICHSVQSRENPGQPVPRSLEGMRIMGWLDRDQPQPTLQKQWTPGSSAVLCRPGVAGSVAPAYALTSPVWNVASVTEEEGGANDASSPAASPAASAVGAPKLHASLLSKGAGEALARGGNDLKRPRPSPASTARVLTLPKLTSDAEKPAAAPKPSVPPSAPPQTLESANLSDFLSEADIAVDDGSDAQGPADSVVKPKTDVLASSGGPPRPGVPRPGRVGVPRP